MLPVAIQSAIRTDVFSWLDRKLGEGKYELTREELENYEYDGTRIPLLDTARGIRNPATFEATLSLMTSHDDPYEDAVQGDGLIHYAFQKKDGGDNTKVVRALELGVPLVYFRGVRDGVYTATYPVYVVAKDDARRIFFLAVDDSMQFFADPLDLSADQRRYADRVVKQRLHQPQFRARVLHAYVDSCAVCELKHVELLDAAHILEDASEWGLPIVSNGLALCKLHHAAYDRNLLGITPDYIVQIDGALLQESDGPMLKHGLQEMHGRRIQVPRRTSERPSKDGLAMRFAEFGA